MAKLTKEEVEHIARLSKLELTEKEKALYQEQLSSVLEYVDQLSEVNTVGVLPLANVTGLENIYRDDEVIESGIAQADIAINAPKFENDSFVVPGVFE